MLEKDIERILVSHDEIVDIARRMGKEITKDYQGEKPIIIGLLKGCIPFLAELIKHIDIYCEIELMGVQSYHGGTESSGNVKITKDLDVSVEGRHIIIAEDIVDTGKTINVVKNLLKYRGALTVEVATLLDKPEGRTEEFVPKYIGTTIPKEFVVGFGLDYDEIYRNLPYIGVLKEEVYKK
ncbi:MAG: hypoxanthine phosphoribosyltransferase [Candidatus Izemoplasmatales bacterium]|nr:hypoxanthine phosphoribosyltransferase [Candidatus Izemoplasmatales bacterium]MDD4068986.1 hypoxanthine phosphoribosyltransferase [Candidatus Izemoplasmatales bacterium]MDY0138313.1 hypoxanthine phosphoribosyltransferase [Candidatus Izemoplasmatales bacterium]